MNRSDGLVQRRNINRESSEGVPKDNNEDKKQEEDVEDGDSKETRLTLMEEVLLLGLKDKEVSFIRLVSNMQIKLELMLGLHFFLERLHFERSQGVHINRIGTQRPCGAGTCWHEAQEPAQPETYLEKRHPDWRCALG